MKITIDRAKSALMEYISDEFCNRLYDYRKWLVPIFIGSYMPKLDKMIEENKEGLVNLGFMDENGLFYKMLLHLINLLPFFNKSLDLCAICSLRRKNRGI